MSLPVVPVVTLPAGTYKWRIFVPDVDTGEWLVYLWVRGGGIQRCVQGTGATLADAVDAAAATLYPAAS